MPSGGVTVKLEGGDELLAKLRRIDGNVKATLRAAGLAGGQVVADVANGMAPGPHIETDVVSVAGSRVTVAIGPDSEHWYYRFVESGAVAHEINGAALLAFEGDSGFVVTPRVSHPGMAARPFLRPAHDSTHDEQRDAMGDVLRRAVESV